MPVMIASAPAAFRVAGPSWLIGVGDARRSDGFGCLDVCGLITDQRAANWSRRQRLGGLLD